MAATAPTTGGLHTGDPVGAPTTTHDPATHDPATHEPAATHTGDRGAKRGGMFGGRKDQEKAVAGEGRGGGFAVNAGARIGLAITQVLTAIAFMVVLGGLSSLQKRANELELVPQQQASYINSFQSGNQVPYPTDGSRQFGLQWWILMLEIVIFVIIFILLVMPRHLLRLKHVAMAFLVYVFVLLTLQINSLLFFNRSRVPKAVYGSSRIRATLAGTIFGAICNALSIIFLGLLREDSHHAHGAAGGKRVGHDTAGHNIV